MNRHSGHMKAKGRFFPDLSIKHKLELIITLVTSVAILTITMAFIIYEQSAYRRRTMDDLSALVEIIGDNCKSALSFDDPVDAKEVLEALRAKEPIMYACVCKADGSLLAEYHREEDVVHPTFPACKGEGEEFTSTGLLVMRKKISMNNNLLGAVLIQSDQSELTSFLCKSIAVTGVMFV